MPKETKKSVISNSVIKRLPRYYRFIGALLKQGVVRISSEKLAEKMSLTASQIRQDLNCFGGFGQQGYGYNLEELKKAIGSILGVTGHCKTVLIGAGNLGKAIAAHMDFDEYGCELIGIFDSDEKKIGENVAGLKVMHISNAKSFFEKNKPQVAILCVPETSAQELADRLVLWGIKAFWNFTHYDITVSHKDVVVENVHLGDSLMMISYALSHSEENE